jgi:hypothetical protein
MWNPDLKVQVQRLEDRFFDYVLTISEHSGKPILRGICAHSAGRGKN